MTILIGPNFVGLTFTLIIQYEKVGNAIQRIYEVAGYLNLDSIITMFVVMDRVSNWIVSYLTVFHKKEKKRICLFGFSVNQNVHSRLRKALDSFTFHCANFSRHLILFWISTNLLKSSFINKFVEELCLPYQGNIIS